MTKFALVIGVSDYEFGFNPLLQAASNAEAIEEVLLDPKLGNFARTNLLFLKNPDRKTIETGIEKLFLGREREDLLLLYFSGRGIKDSKGKLYLSAQNTRKNEKATIVRPEIENGVAAKFVRKNMDRCDSTNQIVILDTCFTSFAEDDSDRIDIIGQLAGDRRIIATASSSIKYRFGKFGEELSEYTSSLIEGIKSGDGDLNDNGFISVRELHDYASKKIERSDRKAKPQISIPADIPEIELLEVYIENPEERYYQQVLERTNDGEITPSARQSLESLRNKFKLTQTKASSLESQVLETLREELAQKLARYKRDYIEAIQQEVAPTEADRQRIKENLQVILGLSNEHTQEVDREVIAEVTAYQNNLQEYERRLLLAMQKENPLTPITLQQLKQMQIQWQLSERDVALAESRANLELGKDRKKLLTYEDEFIKANEAEYPISQRKRQSLRELQLALGLSDAAISQIESRVNERFKRYHQNLERYKQALNQAIDRQYPINEKIRHHLVRLQQSLKLRDEDVNTLEEKIVRQKRLKNSQIQLRQPEPSLAIVPQIKQKIAASLLESKALFSNVSSSIVKKIPDNIPGRLAGTIPKNIVQNSLNNLANKVPKNIPTVLIPRRSYLKWILLSVIGGIAAVLGKNLVISLINANNSARNRERENNNNADRNSDKPPFENNQGAGTKQQQTGNLKSFQFTVVTVNSRGEQINRTQGSANYFSIDLGNGIDLEMVSIPAGTFTMGTPATERRSTNEERPQRQVSIKEFFTSRYQITQQQWQQVASLPRVAKNLNANPANFKGDRLPVETISWQDAIEFCQRLSQKTGHKYRLPSEAEWEYAARANTITPFHYGPTITGDLANYQATFIYTNQPRGRFRNRTIEVGSFPPNAFGLYDMHGNIWEWCQDTWHNNYSGAPQDGSAWISNPGQSRVIRGGSWLSDAISCRSGFREAHPTRGYRTIGFRIVREV